jgi:hypothetical protein
MTTEFGYWRIHDSIVDWLDGISFNSGTFQGTGDCLARSLLPPAFCRFVFEDCIEVVHSYQSEDLVPAIQRLL